MPPRRAHTTSTHPYVQLAFPHPPAPRTMDSLGLLLHTPQAARTQLSISIAEWGVLEEGKEDDWGWWPACEALEAAGEKLVELDIPGLSIGYTLSAVRMFLPRLHTLVLRLDNGAVVHAAEDTDSDEEEGEGEEGGGSFSYSQLRSLTLRMPPGAPPFRIYDCDEGPPLQLHRYPKLQHLVLQGPIVQSGDEDELPFLLPADARVGRAPWVGQVCGSMRAGHKWLVACSPLPCATLWDKWCLNRAPTFKRRSPSTLAWGAGSPRNGRARPSRTSALRTCHAPPCQMSSR